MTTAVSVLIHTSGCLVATQSLNHGKLLNPGERLITTGYGWKHSAKYFSTYHYDSMSIKEIIDSTRMGWLNFIFDYRIGILRKYSFRLCGLAALYDAPRSDSKKLIILKEFIHHKSCKMGMYTMPVLYCTQTPASTMLKCADLAKHYIKSR